jgi:hypothetical protein
MAKHSLAQLQLLFNSPLKKGQRPIFASIRRHSQHRRAIQARDVDWLLRGAFKGAI